MVGNCEVQSCAPWHCAELGTGGVETGTRVNHQVGNWLHLQDNSMVAIMADFCKTNLVSSNDFAKLHRKHCSMQIEVNISFQLL